MINNTLVHIGNADILQIMEMISIMDSPEVMIPMPLHWMQRLTHLSVLKITILFPYADILIVLQQST